MKSKLRVAGVVLAVLFVTGIFARWVEEPAWAELRRRQPALQLESLQGALGQGVTVGLFGGFRAIVADFFWIRTNVVWENYDLPATQTMIKLVSAIDPRPLYFWLNGARMIAYDMPNWRTRFAGGYENVPAIVQRRFDEEQAVLGIAHLERALGFHPDDPQIVLEIANVHLNRLKDVETAAPLYQQAARHPDAPFYAARIYSELLRKLGRFEEAYAWLKEIYPTLPADNDMAMKPLVLERIRELERDLRTPVSLRYQPPREPAPAPAGPP